MPIFVKRTFPAVVFPNFGTINSQSAYYLLKDVIERKTHPNYVETGQNVLLTKFYQKLNRITKIVFDFLIFQRVGPSLRFGLICL